MGDDSTHNNTLTFFFASGIQSRKTFFSAFGDGMIKWFDQFILWQRCFVNRKIRKIRELVTPPLRGFWRSGRGRRRLRHSSLE
jgi:hypothetical protein